MHNSTECFIAQKNALQNTTYYSSGTFPVPVLAPVISSKNKLEAPVYIKPDLTPFERQKERLLLKERRSLIDNGTERRNIKMRNDSLYVNNKLHCKVSTDGNKLEFMSKSVQQTVNAPTTSMESS